MIVNQHTIEKLKNRDEKTFTRIYREYSNLIYYICYSITLSKEVSEDLVQETFIKLLNNLDNYVDDGKFKQFITSIARNLALNYVTRISNYETKLGNDINVDDVSGSDDQYNLLDLSLKGILSQEESDIVILHVVYEYKFQEIADEKKMTIGEVQAKYYKAMDKVEKAYKKGEINL